MRQLTSKRKYKRRNCQRKSMVFINNSSIDKIDKDVDGEKKEQINGELTKQKINFYKQLKVQNLNFN